MRMQTKLEYGKGDKTRHMRPNVTIAPNYVSLADIHRDQTLRAAPCGGGSEGGRNASLANC